MHTASRHEIDSKSLQAVGAAAPIRSEILKFYYLHSLRRLHRSVAHGSPTFAAVYVTYHTSFLAAASLWSDCLSVFSCNQEVSWVASHVLCLLVCGVSLMLFLLALVLRLDFPTARYTPSLPVACIPLVFGSFCWFLIHHYRWHLILALPEAMLLGTNERLSAWRYQRVLRWNWLLSTLQFGLFVSSFWFLVDLRTPIARHAPPRSYEAMAAPFLVQLLSHAALAAALFVGLQNHSSFAHSAYELIARNILFVTEPHEHRLTRCAVYASSFTLGALFVRMLATNADHTTTYGVFGLFSPLLLMHGLWLGTACHQRAYRDLLLPLITLSWLLLIIVQLKYAVFALWLIVLVLGCGVTLFWVLAYECVSGPRPFAVH